MLFIGFLTWQMYVYWAKGKTVDKDYAEVQSKLDRIVEENKKLGQNLRYFANPLNFEKELRARFNYKRLGEKTLIFVPTNDLTSTTQNVQF